MTGGILIAFVLVIALPVGLLVTGAVVSAILGWALCTEVEAAHEGSELIDLNV